MAGVFDSKIFNAEVFQKYIERIPNPARNELIKSRAIRNRPELAQAMADAVGGNYMTTPLMGLISGSAPQNYDGNTTLTPNATYTFAHSRVVVGRANNWVERDFSYDVTGGTDFLENVAQQISEYWNEVDQATIVSILKGIFQMSDAAGAEFVNKHTYSVVDKTNSVSIKGNMDASTLNTGIQKACGDNKGKFSLAIMHSYVATNLENMNLLAYMKYTDAQGISRELTLGTLNGRVVLVDDSMPNRDILETAGVYTLTVSTAATAGDKITLFDTEYTFVANNASDTGAKIKVGATQTAAEQATNIAAKLNAINSGIATKYTITASNATVVFTQKEYGYHMPNVEVSPVASTGTLAAAIVETTASGEYTEYTTYVLGDGAIEYTDCGARVAYEVDRDAKTHGGEDVLYSRQRKAFAPFGISFTKASMAALSPTAAELENGANWELVNSVDSGNKQYINHKVIPIARILSRG